MTFAEEEEQILAVLDEIYETFVISCVLAGKVDIADFGKEKRSICNTNGLNSRRNGLTR